LSFLSIHYKKGIIAGVAKSGLYLKKGGLIMPLGKEFKAAIIGCGNAGTYHSWGYRAVEGCQIVAVCDIDRQRAEKLASECAARPYTDARQMLDEERPDVVSVTVREPLHAKMTVLALEAGAHVFCEKMMADTFEGAKAMLETARRTGKVLGIDYNYRHTTAMRWLKGAIDAGQLGKVVAIHVATSWPTHHHMLDLCRFLAGEVVEVGAALVDDRALMAPLYPWPDIDTFLYCPTIAATFWMRHKTGALSTFNSGMYHHTMEIGVIGTRHHIRFRQFWGPIPREAIAIDPPLSNSLPDLCNPPNVDYPHSFIPSIEAFIQSLQRDKRPPTTG